MLFTNNAAPLGNMFSINQVSPFRLPWIFGYLGDIRVESFIGQLSGLEFQSTLYTGAQPVPYGQYGVSLHPQPFLSGTKISFKLTQNFEFNIAKTTVYGGPGNPLTFKTFFDSTLGKHVNGDPLGDGRTRLRTLPIGFRSSVTGLRSTARPSVKTSLIRSRICETLLFREDYTLPSSPALRNWT